MARPVGIKTRKPSTSNTNPSGLAGGTMGGRPQAAAGARPGARQLQVGEEFYLWVLVIIEVLMMGYLRKHFRRYHGG